MDDTDIETEVALSPNNPFTSVPIEISVCVGKANPMVRDLMTLEEASVLALDKSIDDPVELYVGDRLIAYGKLEEPDENGDSQLLVRITSIVNLSTSG